MLCLLDSRAGTPISPQQSGHISARHSKVLVPAQTSTHCIAHLGAPQPIIQFPFTVQTSTFQWKPNQLTCCAAGRTEINHDIDALSNNVLHPTRNATHQPLLMSRLELATAHCMLDQKNLITAMLQIELQAKSCTCTGHIWTPLFQCSIYGSNRSV